MALKSGHLAVPKTPKSVSLGKPRYWRGKGRSRIPETEEGVSLLKPPFWGLSAGAGYGHFCHRFIHQYAAWLSHAANALLLAKKFLSLLKHPLLILASCLLIVAISGLKSFSGLLIEGLTVPGEVPGDIVVYKEVSKTRLMSVTEIGRVTVTAFAIR